MCVKINATISLDPTIYKGLIDGRVIIRALVNPLRDIDNFECFFWNNFAYAFRMHSACIPHPHFSCILSSSAFYLHSRKSVFFVFQALETKNFGFQGFYFFATFRKLKNKDCIFLQTLKAKK